jgi:hypothetical protein
MVYMNRFFPVKYAVEGSNSQPIDDLHNLMQHVAFVFWIPYSPLRITLERTV